MKEDFLKKYIKILPIKIKNLENQIRDLSVEFETRFTKLKGETNELDDKTLNDSVLKKLIDEKISLINVKSDLETMLELFKSMSDKEHWIKNIKDGIRRKKENETKEEREQRRENRSNKMKEYWKKVHKALAKVEEDRNKTSK